MQATGSNLSKSRQVLASGRRRKILDYRLLPAGLSKSRQVGGDEKILKCKPLAAGLSKFGQVQANGRRWEILGYTTFAAGLQASLAKSKQVGGNGKSCPGIRAVGSWASKSNKI